MRPESVKFFPFAPGLPWRVLYGKYIIPEMPSSVWHSSLVNKEFHIVCYGGFLESFFSLCYLEVLNYFFPQNKKYWCGNKEYSKIVELNGLAKLNDSISYEKLSHYPVPLFFDKENGAYFNCLNNYINVYSYYKKIKQYECNRSLARQLVSNLLLPWELRYIPEFRRMSYPPEDLAAWAKIARFHFNQPYVIIFPDKTKYTHHVASYLDWTPAQVKSLGALLRPLGIKLIIFSDHPSKYYDLNVFILPIRFDYIIYCMKYSKVILSRDIDFVMIGNFISDAVLMGSNFKNQYRLQKVNKAINRENKIFTMPKLKPSDVIEYLKGNHVS